MIVRGLWIGKALSLLEQMSVKSFLCHGHDYELYTYGTVQNVPDGARVMDAAEILPASRIFKYKSGFGKGSYAGFANLFRYKLLYDQGGIWADLDVVCLKPFDFKAPYLFTSERKKGGGIQINNSVIKCPPSSEIMRECYEQAEAIKPERLVWRMNGSNLLERRVFRMGMQQYLLEPAIFSPIDYWNLEHFIDPRFSIPWPDQAYAVHLWNQCWNDCANRESIWTRLLGLSRFNKTRIYSSRTFYGKLQRMYLSGQPESIHGRT